MFLNQTQHMRLTLFASQWGFFSPFFTQKLSWKQDCAVSQSCCVCSNIWEPEAVENQHPSSSPSISLTERHQISISVKPSSLLTVSALRPRRCCCLYWRQGQNMKETIKKQTIKAIIGACRLQSVIKKSAQAGCLFLCPSQRQSYAFKPLCFTTAHK